MNNYKSEKNKIKKLLTQFLKLKDGVDKLIDEINNSEESKTRFSNFENEIDELLEAIDNTDESSEFLKCALWNVQEMITKKK